MRQRGHLDIKHTVLQLTQKIACRLGLLGASVEITQQCAIGFDQVAAEGSIIARQQRHACIQESQLEILTCEERFAG